MRTLIGIDIGGTKTAVVEGDFQANMLQRVEIPTEATLPFSQKAPQLEAQITSLIQNASDAHRTIVGISISVGGPLKIQQGILLNPPHLQGWHGISLKGWLHNRFPELPVFVEHDGNAGALAEFHFGVGKNKPDLAHLIFLTFGTGLGAGIICNSKILHGASDVAGEVGHWRLSPTGPTAYGKQGSWEAFASGAGLVSLAHELFPKHWNSEISIRELVAQMLAKDPKALEVLAYAAEKMGEGIAFLLDAFNPQIIVLGTLGVVLSAFIFPTIHKTVAQEALPEAVAACEIVPATLGTQIGDIASLMAGIVNLNH